MVIIKECFFKKSLGESEHEFIIKIVTNQEKVELP